jgi:hemerythrin
MLAKRLAEKGEVQDMKEVEWTDDLSIGVEVIDEQHKTLIQHLNNLTRAIEQHLGPEKIGATLGFLIDYTDSHFSSEERHMATHDYHGLGDHKLLHEAFKTTLSNLEEDFREEGPTHELADSIDTLLVNWLLKHICGVDVKFGDFLNSNDIVLANES